MNKIRYLALVLAALGSTFTAHSDVLSEALKSGSVSADFRLRYEDVEQDNPLKDASALTLRSQVGYTTGSLGNFSATVEFEDVRIVGGHDSYSVPPTGFKPGEYSVIADPETTELDQGFLQYQDNYLTVKLGRQIITYDAHRFVGHVGWRQDRQTFDALRVDFKPAKGATLSYSYIDQRNGIFAEVADMDARDHLFNASMATPIGKLAAYAYLLEVDDGSDNALDTYGLSLTGSATAAGVKWLYALEYAYQDSERGVVKNHAEYQLAELGLELGGVTAKIGQEVLGSDDGSFGFSTPLATLHKFNGWADIFLATPAVGLVDSYVSLGGMLVGGKWTIVYHGFTADEDTPALDDLGSELDISYARKFAKHYSAGIKYAAYSADDVAVDTDKLWVWVGLSF